MAPAERNKKSRAKQANKMSDQQKLLFKKQTENN